MPWYALPIQVMVRAPDEDTARRTLTKAVEGLSMTVAASQAHMRRPRLHVSYSTVDIHNVPLTARREPR